MPNVIWRETHWTLYLKWQIVFVPKVVEIFDRVCCASPREKQRLIGPKFCYLCPSARIVQGTHVVEIRRELLLNFWVVTKVDRFGETPMASFVNYLSLPGNPHISISANCHRNHLV